MAIDALIGLPTGGLLFGGQAGRFVDRAVQDIATVDSRGEVIATVEARLKSRIEGAARAGNVNLVLPDPGAVSTSAAGVRALGSSSLIAAQTFGIGQEQGVGGGATRTQAAQLQAKSGADEGRGAQVDVTV